MGLPIPTLIIPASSVPLSLFMTNGCTSLFWRGTAMARFLVSSSVMSGRRLLQSSAIEGGSRRDDTASWW